MTVTLYVYTNKADIVSLFYFKGKYFNMFYKVSQLLSPLDSSFAPQS